MNPPLLTFVNHACFYVTNDSSLLLVDPWVEGPAFNNGCSLLDNATSNASLVKEIAQQHRNTFVWFSREHPDHFSSSFVKRLKQDFPGRVTLLYQRSRDGRVLAYLRSQGFVVVECRPGEPVHLDLGMSVSVYPWHDGTSYGLIACAGRTILNLNDCAIASVEQCRAVKSSLPHDVEHIDVLLTQFGYDHWVGNPFETEQRRQAATRQLNQMKLQMAAFRPTVTVPFASFTTFSNVENYYLNDGQNTPGGVARWASHHDGARSVRFMKPGDRLDLDAATPTTLRAASEMAVAHWQRLIDMRGEMLPPDAPLAPADLRAAAAEYRRNMRTALLCLPWCLEQLGLIRPLRIYLPDLALRVRLSYVDPYEELGEDGAHDVSMTSASALFLFRNESGFAITYANGRFRTSDDAAFLRFARFFVPQQWVHQGYGVARPLATLGYLAGSLVSRVQRLLLATQRRMWFERAK